MKVLLVVFALCVAGSLGGLTDEQKVKLQDHKERCIAETGVSPDVVENAKNGAIAENDENLNCFAGCLLRRIGIFDAENNFHEEVLRAKLPSDIPKEKVDAVVDRCKGLTGSTPCGTSGKIFACFLKTKSFNVL